MKTPEELAEELAEEFSNFFTDEPRKTMAKNSCGTGYEAAQEQATENSASITLKDILGMTIEEYLFKHSEEIAEEVLNNNPLLKALKDEQDT